MSELAKSYWTAFYTKPRCEKKAADRLFAKGLEVYCPTRTVIKQWSDRKKKVLEPVFVSYLFGKVDDLSRTDFLMDPGVVSNVRWLGKPVIIRDQEILEIKAFLEEFTASDIVIKEFKEKQQVNITSGPLSGLTGIVKYSKGNKTILTLESLGLEIQAEINVNRLEKA